MTRSTNSVDSLSTAYKLPLHKDRPLLVTTIKSFSVQTELPPSPAATDKMETPPEMKARLGELINEITDDDMVFGISKEPMTEEEEIESKRRLEYFESKYAYKQLPSAREKLSKEAMVHVDINTNVVIQNEWGALTSLSRHFADCYQRLEKSIVVTLTHSACLYFAGSFDPAYVATITTLPSLILPEANQANTATIQQFMKEILLAAPERGLVKFTALSEDNIGTKGQTLTGEIKALEKREKEDKSNLKKGILPSDGKPVIFGSTKRSKSMRSKSMRSSKTSSHPPAGEQNDIPSDANVPPMPPVPDKSEMNEKIEAVRKIGRRKSLMGFFSSIGKGS